MLFALYNPLLAVWQVFFTFESGNTIRTDLDGIWSFGSRAQLDNAAQFCGFTLGKTINGTIKIA